MRATHTQQAHPEGRTPPRTVARWTDTAQPVRPRRAASDGSITLTLTPAQAEHLQKVLCADYVAAGKGRTRADLTAAESARVNLGYEVLALMAAAA